MDSLQAQPFWLTPQHPREGRYVHGPLLGKGGMGEVVEAWDMVLCRSVALKVLRKLDPTNMVRFMREAQLQGRIAHPNICRIYDVEAAEGNLKIAMQLIRGPNLHQFAKDLSAAEAVAIIAQVAEAVNVAHLMKLIHRDIKPSNILLDLGPDGRMTPCLCDFGLARSLAEPALSFSHALAGTPGYMAPEQISGERDRICAGSDIYALGGTLHFALLGHPPPRLAPGSRPRTLKPGLPRDLEKILLKCLEPEPEHRYVSAGVLADDLRRFLNRDPVQARPVGLLNRLASWGRSHARPALAVAAGALVLGLGAAALLRIQLRNRAAVRDAVRQIALDTSEWERDLVYQNGSAETGPRRTDPLARNLEIRIQADLATLGAAFQGPGHAALGRIHFLRGDFAQSSRELAAGWRLGCRNRAAGLELALARVLAAWNEGGTAPPAGEELSSLLPGVEIADRSGPPSLPRALAAFARRDYLLAAAEAGAYHKAHTWHRESTMLKSASLHALAGERLKAGFPPEAETLLQDALLSLEARLEPKGGGAGDPVSHHAYFLAARRLAELQLGEGTLGSAFLRHLTQRCDRALTLDPDHPGLQEDWLALRLIAARRLGEVGMDRFPQLDAALVFLGTRVLEPSAPGLQAERMAIYWQLAEQRLAHGEDAESALAEALKDSARPSLAGDVRLGDVLICKARMEAARGLDPRPTVERAQSLLAPLLQDGPCWPLADTAAEGWLLRAEWEQGHGLDPGASVQEATAQLERTLEAFPGDPRANALQGLLSLLEIQVFPDRKPACLSLAQARLRLCLSEAVPGRLAQRLQRSLQDLR